MVKNILYTLFLFGSLAFAQSSGITYQAVIYNPAGEELPGVDNPYAPLTNQDVCLQFGIVDSDGNLEYQEQVQVTTDPFGMVNLLIGTHTQTGGYAADFANVQWTADAKFLVVDLDIKGTCNDFEELSNQPFTYVPFAYYSPASDIPGPEGPPGPAGAQGPQGEPGPAGADGQDGAVGATGPSGPAGPAGPQGIAGADGQDGAVGATGPQGPQGVAGTDGIDGQDGATGPAGPQGIAGADGQDGNNGQSAYEIWLDLGNTGTEQDFIDSLVGPEGPQGADGSNSTSSNGTDLNNIEGGLKFKRIETYTEFDITVPSGELYLLKSIYRVSSNSNNPAFRVDINGNSLLHSAKYDKFNGNTSSVRPNYMSPNIYLAPNTRIYDAIGEITNGSSAEGIFTFFVYEYPDNFDVLNLTAYDIQSGSEYSIPQGKLANVYQVTQGHNFSDDLIYNSLYFSDNLLNSAIMNVPIQWGNPYDDSLTFELNAFLPENWSISSGSNPVGHFYTILIYDESTISSTEAPPSDLEIGGLFGGGIVTYIAQPGDPIYVEGEIHGLIAPLYWYNPGGGINPLNLLLYPQRPTYTENANENIGYGKSNTELFISLLSEKYNGTIPSSLNYVAFYYCYLLEFNGYDDWFLPTYSELSTLLGLQYSLGPNASDIAADYANDLANDHDYEGNYAHSGGFNSGQTSPGNVFYNMNCCSNGWERFVPMRYF